MTRRRKPQLIPVREPNGRLLRSIESALDAKSPSEVRRLRDAALRGMASPEWGTELGRLFLQGKIGPVVFETGKRLANLIAAYHAAVGAPRDVSPSSLVFQLAKRQAADPASAEGKRQARHDRRIVTAMQEAIAVLDCFGKRRAVMAVLEQNEPPAGESGLSDLMVGLGSLAQHWGLLDLRPKRESA